MCPRFLNEIKSFSKIDFRTKLILSFVVELILVVKKRFPMQDCQANHANI